MEQLYSAFSLAGSHSALVQRIQQGMAQRDAELEALTVRRVAEAEARVKEKSRLLEKAHAQMEEVRIRYSASIFVNRNLGYAHGPGRRANCLPGGEGQT